MCARTVIQRRDCVDDLPLCEMIDDGERFASTLRQHQILAATIALAPLFADIATLHKGSYETADGRFF